MSPFPFIVGCGRSGTTLLRAMLDSHPDLAVAPESYFVIPSLRRQERYGTPEDFRLSALLDDVLLAGSFQEWQLDGDQVRMAITAAGPRSVPQTLLLLYQLYAADRGKAIPCDKTPYHVLHLQRLSQAFPGARFVHVIRDGRDVVPSLVEAPFGPDRFSRGVLYWSRHVEAGRQAGKLLGDRYIEVRYESLVASTEDTLRLLCQFLAIDYDTRLLMYHERASDVLTGLRRTEHLQGIRREPTVGIRDWRRTMTESELRRFEALAGPTLDRLGYEPSPVRPVAPDRLAAVVGRFGDAASRKAAKARKSLGVSWRAVSAHRAAGGWS